MIVNSKYLKKQWSDLPAIGISSLKATDPDPGRTLYVLTTLQLWFQLFSIVLLVVSNWLKESNVEQSNNMSDNSWCKYGLYYDISLFFQICDVILSMYASYHLRSAATRYNNVREVSLWIVVNNFYLLSSTSCFLFVLYRETYTIRNFEICVKSSFMAIYSGYKKYIVDQICKSEKSSFIFLEQGPPTPSAHSSKSTDGDRGISDWNYAVEVDDKSTAGKDKFESLLYAANY